MLPCSICDISMVNGMGSRGGLRVDCTRLGMGDRLWEGGYWHIDVPEKF